MFLFCFSFSNLRRVLKDLGGNLANKVSSRKYVKKLLKWKKALKVGFIYTSVHLSNHIEG